MTGVLGYGIGLYLTSGGDVLTKVLGLLTCNRPNLTVGEAKTTTHDSPGAVDEFIPTTADPGNLKATIHYEAGSATDDLLLEHLASREKRAFKIVTVGPAGALEDNEGICFLTSYEPDDGAVEAVRVATITARVSGLMTQAAA